MLQSACKYVLARFFKREVYEAGMDSRMIEYRPNSHPELETAVVSAIEDGARRVVLDLDRIETLDTDGVRTLITLLRRSRALGGELALRSNNPGVRRTLAVTALDRIFPMDDGEAA